MILELPDHGDQDSVAVGTALDLDARIADARTQKASTGLLAEQSEPTVDPHSVPLLVPPEH